MKSSRLITILTWLSILAVVAISVGPPQARAADIGQMIATAKTAKDQEAIAAYYQHQAAEAREQAAKHAKLVESYANSPRMKAAGPDFLHVYTGHCKTMARYYKEIAKEDDALAKEHSALAQKLSKEGR